MSRRLFVPILLLASASAIAATHHKPAAKPAPAAPQDIDVDAMARAKDVDANASGQTDATGVAAEPAVGAQDSAAAADAQAQADPSVAADPDAGTTGTAGGDALAGEAIPVGGEAASRPEDRAGEPAASTKLPATAPRAGDAQAPATAAAPADGEPAAPGDRVTAMCEARATALLDAAQKGDYAGATRDFDAKMRSALPEAKFRQAWESLARFGALTARGQPHPMSDSGYVAITIPLLFEKANLYAQVACGSDGRVAGFYVKPLGVPAQ